MRRALPIALLLVASCGETKPVEVARRALEVSAEASSIADKTLAREYLRRAEEALSASESYDEWQGRMKDMDMAVDAVGALRESLLAAEYALDAWERHGNSSGWLTTVGCVGASLARVQRAFLEANVVPPEALREAIEMLGDQGARLCGGERLE